MYILRIIENQDFHYYYTILYVEYSARTRLYFIVYIEGELIANIKK